MQSRLCSKALCPATITSLRSRSIRLPVCRQIAALAGRRIHTDGGGPDADRKKYPELEDILGKPAVSFEQLIGQLETLIKHPNPPRNYADALAKEELRRMDHRDLTTDKPSGEHDSSRTRLLRQRPRMLRHMNSELDRGLSADDVGEKAGQDALTDLSDTPDASSNVSSAFEVPPLPEEVAINLGITAEQQERRRIWMTKIAGYRAFRSNLMSMNSLLNNLDERREAERSNSDAAERVNDQELDDGQLLGPEFEGKALLDDDREFEELIRKSWKLYDEDFVDPDVDSVATSSDTAKSGALKSNHPSSLGGIAGKRTYHTSRAVYQAPSPDKKPSKHDRAGKREHREGGTVRSDYYNGPKPSSRNAKAKDGEAAESGWSSRRMVLSRVRSVQGHSTHHPSKGPRSLIRRAFRPSLNDLKRHFAERDEYVGEIHVPIDATVSTGDIIEMRQTVAVNSATQYGVAIAIGGVVQKTTGRFHFNYVSATRDVLGGREARLGFVAKGLLFDKKLLLRSGVTGDNIKRILAYAKELREYEAEHGEHILTSSYDAMQLQRTFSTDQFSGLVDKDIGIGASVALPTAQTDDLLPDYQAQDALDGVAVGAGSNGASADSEESISDLLVVTFPRALRTFQQDAEQLMRSYIRELSEYWDLAVGRGQTFVTVDSLARLTFGNRSEDAPLSEVERFAAYMHMANDPLHFIPDADGLFVTGRFELRPRTEVDNIVTVRDHIRENTPEFKQFIEKARNLVAYAHTTMPLSPLRAALDPTVKSALAAVSCKLTGWTPDLTFIKRKLPTEPVLTEKKVAEMKFTLKDSQFLLALRSYVFHSNAGFQNLANPYQGLISPILKKMNYYSGCDETSVARFLVDLGVWPHWYNQKLNMRDQAHAGFHRYKNKYLVERGASACSALYSLGAPEYVDVDTAGTSLLIPDAAGSRVAECTFDVKAAQLKVPDVRPSIITQSSTGVGIIDSSKLYGRDICEDIRHDFGHMPVYTIDDATTRDVDDGMSLETVVTAGGEEQEWIHVHIADPTALIHPGHIIAHAASQQMTSIYYTTETRNMLPINLVLNNISLVRRNGAKGPKPVNTMTLSCRLGDDGDIVDYKIRPGIVRNIIATPYEAADQHLSYERPLGGMNSLAKLQESQQMTTYIHPFVPADAKQVLYGANKAPLSEDAVRTLRRLQELARRHFDFRVRAGSFTRLLPNLDISVNNGRIVPRPTFLMERPTFLNSPHNKSRFNPLEFPKITTSYSSVVISPAHSMVSEMMIISGRVASRYAYEHGPGTGSHGDLTTNDAGVITGERGVPMLFRSQSMPNLDALSGVAQGLPLGVEGLSATEAQSARAVWDAVLAQARRSDGIVDSKLFDEVRHMLNPSILSSTPGPHTIMGLHDKYGYTRITSPIRRMDDLVGHWQLKAQLLADHTGSKDRRPWYWNHYDIERLAPTVFRRAQQIEKASRMDTEFWILTLMRRMESEARRGKLQVPPEGFYDANSPLYFDTPWAYYNMASPGPLTWTAMVDNRDESRPFISLVIAGLGVRAMLTPRPLDPVLLPFAGTKVRVQIIGLDPANSMLMVKLAPQEYQPVETPKFWGSTSAANMMFSGFHLGRTPPEDAQQAAA